ncbi:MAG: hypothetical protein KIT27_03220 [Legionellales bacterium]|nr:hypothetical protein [Legionellales bacterium]
MDLKTLVFFLISTEDYIKKIQSKSQYGSISSPQFSQLHLDTTRHKTVFQKYSQILKTEFSSATDGDKKVLYEYISAIASSDYPNTFKQLQTIGILPLNSAINTTIQSTVNNQSINHAENNPYQDMSEDELLALHQQLVARYRILDHLIKRYKNFKSYITEPAQINKNPPATAMDVDEQQISAPSFTLFKTQ